MSTEIIDHLLEPSQAASVLGVSKGTLAVWRCTGAVKIPYVLIGRKVMYRPGDLNAFIASCTVGGE